MHAEPFTLTGRPKISRQKFPHDQRRQAVLFCGLDDSPGQENLFPTDGREEEVREQRAEVRAEPEPAPPLCASAPLRFDPPAAPVAEPKDIDQAEPGDLIQAATRNPWGRIEPAWLLFMKMLPRADARRIAREEGGRAVCYDHARQRFAVLVPQIEE